jgi:hypothetical protein
LRVPPLTARLRYDFLLAIVAHLSLPDFTPVFEQMFRALPMGAHA